MAKNQIVTLLFKDVEIGKVGYDADLRRSSFQYSPEFLKSDQYKRFFPYIIRRTPNVQIFTDFEGATFRGLPPMIADSLPDYFGNVVFKEWLEAAHRDFAHISPLEQLTYVGKRGMGALEFLPIKELSTIDSIDLDGITEVVRKVLDVKTSVHEKELSDAALLNIFKLGTSAGGARPKILVSEHKLTGELKAGDLEISADYNHYLIKLGIDEKAGYSKETVEYIYSKLAGEAGIEMMPTKMIDEKHFATLRFDRQAGEKQHILTACGMTGWDFQKPEHSSYENLFRLCVDLELPHKDIEQLYRRMVFNIVFANTDDHLKNFSFIYNSDKDRWNLAPAYDLTYPLDALLNYTRVIRALSLNGKRTHLTRTDVLKIAEEFTIKNPMGIIDRILSIIPDFRELSNELNVPEKVIDRIESAFSII